MLDVRKAGFDSFNIDLMYGFPVPKSGSAFAQTVKDVISLQPVCPHGKYVFFFIYYIFTNGYLGTYYIVQNEIQGY